MTDVLIVGEPNQGVSQSLRELVTASQAITGTGGVFAAMLGGEQASVDAAPVKSVHLAVHENLGEPDSATFDAATSVLTAMVNNLQPDVVLFSSSDASSVIAPRVAARLGGVFARDCTRIEEIDGTLTVTRPVYGGNAIGRFRLTGAGPHVISVRPGSYEPSEVTDRPEVIEFDATPHIGESRSTLIRTVQEAREGVRLEDADVVVSGGRGLGGPEPFEQLSELADLLGGAVGASRAACDASWIDHSQQVGLTGKSVSPRLYLSFGISGASQHMAGCSSARNIVAVNTDPDASIFKDARYGVVGDWSKVLPALISALRDIG